MSKEMYMCVVVYASALYSKYQNKPRKWCIPRSDRSKKSDCSKQSLSATEKPTIAKRFQKSQRGFIKKIATWYSSARRLK